MQSTQDTLTFIKKLKEIRYYNNFLVSLDVSSLFTNIPLNEIIELALDLNGDIYEQVDGVVISFPLAPVLANLFTGHHEQHWLIEEEALLVLF